MATTVYYINPLRFRQQDSGLYDDNFIPLDSRTQRTQYFRGVIPLYDYYPDWLLGDRLEIQVRTYADTIGIIYLPDGSSVNMDRVNVTPAVWSGDSVIRFQYRPNTEGLHYVVLQEDDGDGDSYISDIFNVRSNDNKELLKFDFSDTQNRYGGYFYDSGGTRKWFSKAYYTGKEIPGQPEDEVSTYDDDAGDETDLQNTPKKVRNIILTEIHEHYIDTIKQQTICDTFKYEGCYWNVSDFAIEPKDDKADMYDITFKLKLQNNDYSLKW